MKLFTLLTSALALAMAHVSAQSDPTQEFGFNRTEMLCIVNLVRARAGADLVILSDQLSGASLMLAAEMDATNTLSDTIAGQTPEFRLEYVGIQWGVGGETIAKEGDLTSAMQYWLNNCGKTTLWLSSPQSSLV